MPLVIHQNVISSKTFYFFFGGANLLPIPIRQWTPLLVTSQTFWIRLRISPQCHPAFPAYREPGSTGSALVLCFPLFEKRRSFVVILSDGRITRKLWMKYCHAIVATTSLYKDHFVTFWGHDSGWAVKFLGTWPSRVRSNHFSALAAAHKHFPGEFREKNRQPTLNQSGGTAVTEGVRFLHASGRICCVHGRYEDYFHFRYESD